MHQGMRHSAISAPVLLAAPLVLIGWPALAADTDSNRPARSIRMAVAYPGIEIEPGEDFSMDVISRTRGRSDENVSIWLAGFPPDCKASIQTYRFKVSGIYVKSPMKLYSDSTATIVDPLRKTTRTVIQVGVTEPFSMARFSGPLPLSQGMRVVMPYIISLIAITVLCFAVCDTIFMCQEVRSL